MQAHPETITMRRIRLLIEYDGTNYRGWQSQRGGGTVQDIITEAVSAICGEGARLAAASRTDAGVHALGQVASFTTLSALSADVIRRALNATLPRDIRVLGSEEADPSFHPRYSALSKSYYYVISMGNTHSAFMDRYCWTIPHMLDLDSMREAASVLCGEHDFSSFMGAGCSSKHQVRAISSVDVDLLREIPFMTAAIKGGFIRIRIEANAFLRHMVRNIVGTLVEAGKGRIAPSTMGGILQSRDRTKAGPTAPAKGLFLEKINY